MDKVHQSDMSALRYKWVLAAAVALSVLLVLTGLFGAVDSRQGIAPEEALHDARRIAVSAPNGDVSTAAVAQHGSADRSPVSLEEQGLTLIRAMDAQTGALLVSSLHLLGPEPFPSASESPATEHPVRGTALAADAAVVVEGYEVAVLAKGLALTSPLHDVPLQKAGFLEVEFVDCEPAWFVDRHVSISIHPDRSVMDARGALAVNWVQRQIRVKTHFVRMPMAMRFTGNLFVLVLGLDEQPVGQVGPIAVAASDRRIVVSLAKYRDLFDARRVDIDLVFLDVSPVGAMKLELRPSAMDALARTRLRREAHEVRKSVVVEALPAGIYEVVLTGSGFLDAHLGRLVHGGPQRSHEFAVHRSGGVSVACSAVASDWHAVLTTASGTLIAVESGTSEDKAIDFAQVAPGDYVLSAFAGSNCSVPKRVRVQSGLRSVESLQLVPSGVVVLKCEGAPMQVSMTISGDGCDAFTLSHMPGTDLVLPAMRWRIDIDGKSRDVVIDAGARLELR